MTAPRLATLVALVSLLPHAALGQAVEAPEAPAAAAGAGTKTVAVATLAGYDALMQDVDFIGELGGRPATADMVEGMLAFFTGGRGLEGLDKSKPVGVILQTDGSNFTPLGCLPVADVSPMLELAENFGYEPLDAGNGVYELELPDQTLYFKNSGQWTYLGQSAAALADTPADPGDDFAELSESYDLGIQLYAQEVPAMYKALAIDQMRKGMDEGLVQEDDESDEDFAARRKMTEAQIDQLVDMIDGLDEVTIGWQVDAEGKQTFLDVELTGVEGSDMALALSVYGDSTSGVSGFHRPATAASMLTIGATPPELLEKQKEQMDATVEMLRKQAQKGIEEADELPDDPEVREAIASATDDLIDAYGEMLRSGKVEIGASLDLAGEGYDLIAAAFVVDPSKVESAFKKLATAAEKQEGFPGVEWGYAEHGGVTMHGMTIPLPADDPKAARAREVFGESIRVVMGVGGERVYLAAGPRCEASLKKAIDDSASMADKQVLPAEITLSLKQCLTAAERVADGQGAMVIGMMLESLEKTPADADHIVFTAESIDNGARLRYLLEEGVLKAIGQMAAQAAAMQQQGGGGF